MIYIFKGSTSLLFILLGLLVPEMFGYKIVHAWAPWWALTTVTTIVMFVSAAVLRDMDEAAAKKAGKLDVR